MKIFHARLVSLLKRLSYLLLLISLLFCAFIPVNSSADDLCSETNATLDCLSKNFEKLYVSNYQRFWDILHNSLKKAQQCGSNSEVISFLELAHLKSNNAEFNEFFNETIENMCVKNTECFFNALVGMKEEDQNEIVGRIKNPMFFEQDSITETFLKYKNNAKYKKIVEKYFRAMSNSD